MSGKKWIFIACFSLNVWLPTSAETAKSPNVMFVVFDDLNTWIEPIGEYPDVKTPHLNRLAARAVTFRQAHCQAPVCGPSRVSFLSGLRPSTTGEYSLLSTLHDHPTYGMGKHKPIHQYFKESGYQTATCGKVFHNAVPEFSAIKKFIDHIPDGKSYNYGKTPAKKLADPAISGRHPLVDWGVFPENDSDTFDYQTVSWAIERIADLTKNSEKPFFFTIGISRPHVPLFAAQKWFDLYPLTPERSFARPFYEADDLDDIPRFARYLHWKLPEPRTEALIEANEWDKHTQAYLACVSYADSMFGRLLDALEDPNSDGNPSDSIADETIIVVLSDHGYHLGEKGLTAKTTLWDRATRVPLIISAPKLSRNQVCAQPVELLDLYPTLLDLCGLEPYKPLEGISLRTLLENPKTAPARRPAITTHGPNNHSVVDATHRYIRYADGSEELYDQAIDPNEIINRITDPKYREIADRLATHIPTINVPHQKNETVRIATIEEQDILHWEGKPIHDPADSATPVTVKPQ